MLWKNTADINKIFLLQKRLYNAIHKRGPKVCLKCGWVKICIPQNLDIFSCNNRYF